MEAQTPVETVPPEDKRGLDHRSGGRGVTRQGLERWARLWRRDGGAKGEFVSEERGRRVDREILRSGVR